MLNLIMNIDTPYRETTHDIEIKAAPLYDEERSLPDQNVFIFMYGIEFENHSGQTVQLISRHWVIRNGRGEEQKVEGAGVVGEQPILKPGDVFHYSSQCPLDTPTGSMRGHYIFRTIQGKDLEVKIPPFFLRLQDTLENLNNIYGMIH